ncbi:iron-containing alcohol dehydrogenase [candidate division KSB1 bacterium]
MKKGITNEDAIFKGIELNMKERIQKAARVLMDWKGDSYAFGTSEEVLDNVGEFARNFGKKAVVVAPLGEVWAKQIIERTVNSLNSCGVEYLKILDAKPNAPKEDVYRIALRLSQIKPDVVIPIGGGSNIDAAKGASVLASFSPSEAARVLDADEKTASTIEPYFGVGNVTKIIEGTGKSIIPILAIQTAASSAAHLTKYSNITDPVLEQKKLIVDEAIVPPVAVFDYSVTLNSSTDLTLDGGLDGIAHCWEVFTGATGQDYYEKVKEIAQLSIWLIVNGLSKVKEEEKDIGARVALGLGTDLGGYAIMIGGTGGPHLGSFSLVGLCSHGRACSILNPYYTVLFAEKIQDQLKNIGNIYEKAGYIKESIEGKEGKELGILVAKGMIEFSKALGFPTTLREIGATSEHIEKMLTAAKNPQLKMKLQNMPRPMDAEKGDIEHLMKPTLEAALSGNLETIV